MYEETVLPTKNKFSIPSRSQTRLHFVRKQTKNSLAFLKWVELVVCFLCLAFAIPAIHFSQLSILNKCIIITSNTASILIVLTDITYQYFKRTMPLFLQLLESSTNVVIFSMLVILIYSTNSTHELLRTLLLLNGFGAVLFLVEFMCKIIISTYLYQSVAIKSVADVGISTMPPASSPPRPKAHRSVLTATPITYGGTFPVGKNQPPFLPDCLSFEENAEKTGSKHRGVQTAQYGDSRAIGRQCADCNHMDRALGKYKVVQIYSRQEDKGTSMIAPFYLDEDRRKKSPWTFSAPNSSRKIDPRKQMTTPSSYSGTFAVNKELVPISGSSPKTSPRGKKPISRSEGNSPTRQDNFFQEGRLDQISEEKMSLDMSAENCSISRSNCAFYENCVLPGSVLQGDME